MAEDSGWPTGKDGSHPAGFPRKRTVPHRVDLLLNAMQRVARNPVSDSAGAQAQLEQLGVRYHAVLCESQSREARAASHIATSRPHRIEARPGRAARSVPYWDAARLSACWALAFARGPRSPTIRGPAGSG